MKSSLVRYVYIHFLVIHSLELKAVFVDCGQCKLKRATWNRSNIGPKSNDLEKNICYSVRVEGFFLCLCWWVGGGVDSSSVSSGYLTNVCTRPHSPPLLPQSPLRLIKLDQDDTNNWLKLGPVRRPNDPYLTPFVAMVSLFPRRAPFGTVYLGSVASVLAQSPAEHSGPLTS